MMNKTPRNAQGKELTFKDVKVWLAGTGPNHLICHEGWYNFIIPAMRMMADQLDEWRLPPLRYYTAYLVDGSQVQLLLSDRASVESYLHRHPGPEGRMFIYVGDHVGWLHLREVASVEEHR